MKHFVVLFILSIGFIAMDEQDELGELFQQKKYSEVISRGTEFIKKNKDDKLAYYLVGRSYVETGVPDSGTINLQRAIVLDDQSTYISAWSYAYLGLVNFLQDSIEPARINFQRCLELNKTENSSSFARTFLFGTKLNRNFNSWQVKESEHFIFHFQDTTGIKSVSGFISGREEAYRNIHRYFKADPPKKCEYYVWNSKDEAFNILKQKIGFTQANINLIHSHKEQTAGHEITHWLSYWSVKPLTTSRFVNEGLAVHFDQAHYDRLKMARQALAGYPYNGVLDIWTKQNQVPANVLYAVAGAFMEYLHEKGTDEQFRNLLYEQTLPNAEKIYAAEWKQYCSRFDELIRAE